MTDHNAEGGKMVEACAWCRKEPEVEPEPELLEISFCRCRCPLAFPDGLTIGDWNRFQIGILAQRRKDFEAGFRRGVDSGDNWPHFDNCKTFDDYLASTRK